MNLLATGSRISGLYQRNNQGNREGGELNTQTGGTNEMHSQGRDKQNAQRGGEERVCYKICSYKGGAHLKI